MNIQFVSRQSIINKLLEKLHKEKKLNKAEMKLLKNLSKTT